MKILSLRDGRDINKMRGLELSEESQTPALKYSTSFSCGSNVYKTYLAELVGGLNDIERTMSTKPPYK
jgi:hypothetical protein